MAKNRNIIIYIIYHSTYENTNIFTTNKNKINDIIKTQEEKYKNTIGEWKYTELVEETEFEGDIGSYAHVMFS
jgi:hypothetical protein